MRRTRHVGLDVSLRVVLQPSFSRGNLQNVLVRFQIFEMAPDLIKKKKKRLKEKSNLILLLGC